MTSDLKARLDAMVMEQDSPHYSSYQAVLKDVALSLLSKLDASEAEVKELEAKLAECCYVIRSMTSRAVLDGFESPDELEAWMKQIFNTGYKWLQENRDLVKQDDEARKRGAEHGE